MNECMAVRGFDIARQLGDDWAAASAFSQAQLVDLAGNAFCGFVVSAAMVSFVIATPWISALSVKPGALPDAASEQPGDGEAEQERRQDVPPGPAELAAQGLEAFRRTHRIAGEAQAEHLAAVLLDALLDEELARRVVEEAVELLLHVVVARAEDEQARARLARHRGRVLFIFLRHRGGVLFIFRRVLLILYGFVIFLC